MTRMIAAGLVAVLGVVGAGTFGTALPRGGYAGQPAGPAYLRTALTVCATNAFPCRQPLFGPEISLTKARAAWVQVVIDAGPVIPGNPNRPLDQTPHQLRLVVAKSLYRTDAPLALERSWSGTIRGRLSWKLSSLAALPARRGQPNYFRFLVSVDGWPTTAEQIIAIPL